MKNLLILKIVPKAASNLCTGFPFLSLYIRSRLSEQFSGSQVGFETTFKDTGGFQKAGISSLKRLLEGMSQLVNDFILHFRFPSQKGN